MSIVNIGYYLYDNMIWHDMMCDTHCVFVYRNAGNECAHKTIVWREREKGSESENCNEC